jgi:hypothetical protein
VEPFSALLSLAAEAWPNKIRLLGLHKMAQLSNSNDVYGELVEESEESWFYGLLAFAIVEEQRIEWMKHFLEHNGGSPTAVDIQHWYEQQPPNVLLRAKGGS